MCSKFPEEHSLEKRKYEADRTRKKYPKRIPVIFEKVEGSDIPTAHKRKYLVPCVRITLEHWRRALVELGTFGGVGQRH